MEMIKVLRDVTETNKVLAQQPRPAAEPPEAAERVSAISGLEYKQNLPIIKDLDTNLDKHIREFQSILDCHTLGKKGIRAYDMLTLFRKTLAPGSTRLRVYETEFGKARKTDGCQLRQRLSLTRL